jgi:hypothetical protein
MFGTLCRNSYLSPQDTDPNVGIARTQALCWLLDELLDAEDDLLELVSRPRALVGWRRERLGEFCEWVGEGLAEERVSAVQALAGFSVAVPIQVGVPLAEQLLGAVIGADLLEAVPASAGDRAGRPSALRRRRPVAASVFRWCLEQGPTSSSL